MAGAVSVGTGHTNRKSSSRPDARVRMEESDRPNLGTYALEQLEDELHRQDLRYWDELQDMQVTAQHVVAFSLLTCGQAAPPSPPKRPQHLLAILSRYADTLFYVEASAYPKLDPRFHHWLEKLAERVEERIIQRIKQLESAPIKSLTYHGVTESQMRKTVKEAGRASIVKFIGDQAQRDQETPQGEAPSQKPIITQPQPPRPAPVAGKKHRLSPSIVSPSAARKMEQYIQAKGIGLTDFATRAGTTDRTLRNFRTTGKVKRDIFESIAKAMGTTKDALLSD